MVTVRVPATTANLAAGFDSMGCALGLYNTLSFTPAEELSFTGCDKAYQNEENLAYQAYCRVLHALGLEKERVKIDIDAKIPVSRGLGSSAALLAAGAIAANALHGSPLSRNKLLSICTELEGHPDNVAAAIFGGLTVSFMEGKEVISVSYDVHPDLRFVALIPEFPLSTHAARSVLPANVPYADAVFNTAHAAVLPGAFAQGDEKLLAAALQDRLHQPYRRSLIHEYNEVEAIAAKNGCNAFCVSGAGPTLLALTKDPSFVQRMTDEVKCLSYQWQVVELSVDFEGAAIVSQSIC
ncbi:MAG: homoserine kinase [Oscillospiraceae bacterium]|nr:homoserine kinase [Oscillospiraceae bacterium]